MALQELARQRTELSSRLSQEQLGTNPDAPVTVSDLQNYFMQKAQSARQWGSLLEDGTAAADNYRLLYGLAQGMNTLPNGLTGKFMYEATVKGIKEKFASTLELLQRDKERTLITQATSQPTQTR